MTTQTSPMASPISVPDAPAPIAREQRKRRSNRILPASAWWIVSICVAILFLYPLYVLVTQSLKNPAEAVQTPPTLFPHGLSFDNFAQLGSNAGGLSLLGSLGNSLFVTLLTTAITVVVSTLAGYAFAKLPFRGSRVAFFVTLITFMVPFQAIITPIYLTLKDVGLQNNLFGLTLVLATFNLPFGIFLMRNSFAAIPASIEEAAMIDGASAFGAMRRVMLPNAVPGIVSTALLTFFAAWNDFFATLILITDQSKYTLPVSLGILSAGQNNSVDWGLLEAGVAVTVIPCVVIYLVLQKYYTAGLLSGAVK
ncbi:carbohydrate ABC transporter permease [Leifsonia poae]|uniref:carbohydrate ABC transporter permease n=1 Tax=Leifsonia poae TaxID=110933 RepID=UPI003D663E68